MRPVEYGNLYKFKVSLGLVLAIAPTGAIWMFGQYPSILELRETEIEGFTESARRVIENRQSRLAFIQGWPLWLVLGIAISTGVYLVYSGVSGWAKGQVLIDENEQMNVDERRAKFGSDTRPEAENLKIKEIKEEIKDQEYGRSLISEFRDGETEGYVESGESSGRSGEGSPEAGTEKPTESAEKQRREEAVNRRRELTRKSEELLSGLFRSVFEEKFRITENPWVEFETSLKLRFDLLLEPREGESFGDLAVEFRVLHSRMVTFRWADVPLRMALVSTALNRGTVYTGKAGRPPRAETSAVVVYIINDYDDSDSDRIERQSIILNNRLTEANNVLINKVGSLIISATSLRSIGVEEFRSSITGICSGRSLNTIYSRTN